jgi:DNA-directed RNA polymerase specialized sigma24 family protein
MSPVLILEKAGLSLWDLIAKECDSETIDLINQKIQDTWKQIECKYGEDIAQEALCQAFEKAAQGKVEKPLHYAAKSARRIAKDEGKRQRFLREYHVPLSAVGLDWVEPERDETDEALIVEFQKTPPEAHIYWDPVSHIETLRRAREIDHDPGVRRLISQTDGESVRISASQASKVGARVLKRVLEECVSKGGSQPSCTAHLHS